MSVKSSPVPASSPVPYSSDPTLYLYTSLTAGSSHIITATSRLETILKANKIPFRAIDVATDEKARMLWGRRSKGRKLPGLVRMGLIVGDLEEIEEWNEYGELDEHVGDIPKVTPASTPSKGPTGPATPVGGTPLREVQSTSESNTPSKGVVPTPLTLALRQAGEDAAKKANEIKAGSKRATSNVPTPASTLPTSSPEKDSDLDTAAAAKSPALADSKPEPDQSANGVDELEKTAPTAVNKPAEEGDTDKAVDTAKDTTTAHEVQSPSTPPNPSSPSPRSPDRPAPLHIQPSPLASPSVSRSSSRAFHTVTHTHHGYSHTHTIPDSPSFSPPPSQHRGSSISLVSDEEIREIEMALAIKEEENEDSDSAAEDTTPENDVPGITIGGETDTKEEKSEVASIETPAEEEESITPEDTRDSLGSPLVVERSTSVDERNAALDGGDEKHISFAGESAKAAKEKAVKGRRAVLKREE